MDPVTHALSGVLLKKAGAEQKSGWPLTFFCAASAMLPDIDFIMRIFGRELYLLHHRGVTHSFIGALLLCFFWSFLFSRFSRTANVNFLFKLSIIAVSIHLLLDFITSYGTSLFYPLGKRFALDYVFIIDLVFTGILLLFIFICRKSDDNSARIARFGFLALTAYIGLCGTSHWVALSKTEDWSKNIKGNVLKISAIPKPFTFADWAGIIETPKEYHHAYFNIFSKNKPEWTVFPKRNGSPFIQISEKTPMVKKYYHFARFPVVHFEQTDGKYLVEYHDIRFQTKQRKNRVPFILRLAYDDDKKLISSQLLSGQPRIFLEAYGEKRGEKI